MQILTTIREMREACAAARAAATRAAAAPSSGHPPLLGLIPTMGALHDGHLSLMRAAKLRCHIVVASIFVNPAQFGPHEDLASYPRTFEEDCAKLKAEEVDLLFAPAAREMYPLGDSSGAGQSFVDVPGIGERLDGRSRPGHFRGVATVVAKLFNIITPDVAYFGQKDAAQVAVLQAMVQDLNFPVELIVAATVRDADGLAMSSRNRYLDAEDRQRALVLSQVLNKARALVAQGLQDAGKLRLALLDTLQATPGLQVDYVEVVNPGTLEVVPDIRRGALIAVAAWVGKTRLIDNLVLPPVGVLDTDRIEPDTEAVSR